MIESLIPKAQKQTRGLIDFLIEMTEGAERNPVLDVLTARESWKIQWTDDIPAGAGKVDLSSDDVLFRIRPPVREPAPRPSGAVESWLDQDLDWTSPVHEPRIRQPGTEVAKHPGGEDDLSPGEETGPPQNVVREFHQWLGLWRAWAQERQRAEQRQDVYDFVEGAAKDIEQRDDETELVVAHGLVNWAAPSGMILRRHLITEQVLPSLNRGTAEVEIRRIGSAIRYEDSLIFGEEDGYQHDRAEDVRAAIGDAFEKRETGERSLQLLGEWVSRCTGTGVQAAPGPGRRREPSPGLEVSMSPAFILRPRSKAMLAEAYKRISRELQEPSTPLPVALAQLVIDSEPEQRQQWIEQQNGVTGNVLGDDPRFPLDANPEQERVMELLRIESGVVVQGPPGTGKTHTIANLLCALLARGQRVLVTSQKDQALRVLRDKIPAEIRNLCVLLAGGSKDAAAELEQGLDALSQAVATSDRAALRRKAKDYAEERVQLRSETARLNSEIRELRAAESKHHDSAVPWHEPNTYSGTLGDIVHAVKHLEPSYGWFPDPEAGSFTGPPPIAGEDLRQLRRLLTEDNPGRRARMGQLIPEPKQIPPLSHLVQLAQAEQTSAEEARQVETPASLRLAGAGEQQLTQLDRLRREAIALLQGLGFDETGKRVTAPEWADRALNDLFARRNLGLWTAIFEIRDEASGIESRIQAQGIDHVVEVTTPAQGMLGAARGALHAGRGLESYLRQGGRMKRRFPSRAQSDASGFLALVRVDGQPPKDLATVEAAVAHLEAEVAMMQLTDRWADCGVTIPSGRFRTTLSLLADNGNRLNFIGKLQAVRNSVQAICETHGTAAPVSSLESTLALLDAVPAARSRLKHLQSRARLTSAEEAIRVMAECSDAAPEITTLLDAVRQRDPESYGRALEAVEAARAEQAEASLLEELSGRLATAHPRLLSLLTQTAREEAWDDRLPDLAEAWAWRQAARFVASQRPADRERELSDRYQQLEDQIQCITAQLAAAEAMLACLERMSDEHARALRTYREHMASIGAGTGKRVRVYRRAARAAMDKAKGAVPAWVVPLPNLLDNLPAERNSFDVVIIDEASQVGMEQLFLLWLAPRVIVVGDDRQCTPGENRLSGTLDRVFQELSRHLGDVPPDIQTLFTPKTNLYGLLSARSGKNSVIRLREHFRCVPEIIRWPSAQFYSVNGVPGLIPLRERKGEDLPPLVTRHVDGAWMDGIGERRRNPVEAKAIADQLAACLGDPRYEGKTFGVVVLQSRGQVRLLDHEINTRISPEDREKRKIRVGLAPDFQGDERDVIFLSMMVASSPRAQRQNRDQQAYNVAVSRAKDQLWLFTSVTLQDLRPDDLRASLLGYMMDPPSPFGPSPALGDVSGTEPRAPFESLLEQRVFREIRERGYHVVPQYPVGPYTLDLVVVGEGARVAVECDGHRYHTSPDQVASDARRDRELGRMRWEVIRIRESEFEFDRERELDPLWTALAARGITPRDQPEPPEETWAPVPLEDGDIVDEEGTSA